MDTLEDARIGPSLAIALRATLRLGRPQQGYAQCVQVVRGDDELARVLSHSARLGEVHIVVTGVSCDEVVPLVRRLWPEHRCSRVDVAVDLLVPWTKLDRVALRFATEHGLKHRLVTDSDGGATRYLGAPSSEVRVRVYRKSEQLRALHPDRADEVPDGIVRVELQARPSKRATKEAVARMTPGQVWGLSRWGTEFAALVLAVDAPRVSTHARRPSDYSRALWYLARQYGPLLRLRAAEIGRQEAVDELLEAVQL